MFVGFFCIPFHVLCSADTQSETHLSPVSIGIEFAVYDVNQNIVRNTGFHSSMRLKLCALQMIFNINLAARYSNTEENCRFVIHSIKFASFPCEYFHLRTHSNAHVAWNIFHLGGQRTNILTRHTVLSQVR